MSFFGTDRVCLDGSLTVRNLRPPPTAREMLDEAKAQEELAANYVQVAFMDGHRLDREPTFDETCLIGFTWRWIKKQEVAA